MADLLFTILTAAVVLGAIFKLFKWRENYQKAKSSGFPTYSSPVHFMDTIWILAQPLLIPLAKRLPKALNHPWLPMTQVFRVWKAGFQSFVDCGTNTFMLASPSGNMMWTCDPAVVSQVFNQHTQCHLPIEHVQLLNIYGNNIGSVEGDEWKMHRKVVSAGFNSSMNGRVWRETLDQTQVLLRHWTTELDSVVLTTKKWTSRLALHVICASFFDKRLEWSDYTTEAEPLPPGHSLRFEEALFMLLNRLGVLSITPRPLLDLLPIEAVKEAKIGLNEWTKYITKLRDNVAANVEEIDLKKNKTILEAIVVAGTPGLKSSSGQVMPQEMVLGNIFFTLLAGHETTGNALSFILVLLCIFPEYQKRVQEQLDQQLGQRPMRDWTIEEDYPALYRGWLGAVQKEALRLYTVAQYTWRKTVEPATVTDSKGHSHTIPIDTLVLLDFSAAFQHPSFWGELKGTAQRRQSLHNSPALQFDPSRWIEGSDLPGAKQDPDAPTWYPFGQGPRSCLGRAFSQAEMVAAMAAIFKTYSLELVISPDTLNACGGDKATAWESTRDAAMRTLYDGVEMNISLHLAKELPIRLVPRRKN